MNSFPFATNLLLISKWQEWETNIYDNGVNRRKDLAYDFSCHIYSGGTNLEMRIKN